MYRTLYAKIVPLNLATRFWGWWLLTSPYAICRFYCILVTCEL